MMRHRFVRAAPVNGEKVERRNARNVEPIWRRPVCMLLPATLMILLLLSSCAAGPNPAVGTGEDQAGFWLGLWHGVIFPVTFLISLFTDNVSVYEVANNGNWYDFGFLLGVMVALGGGGAGSQARRRG